MAWFDLPGTEAGNYGHVWDGVSPLLGFPGGSVVKNPRAMQEMKETWVWSLGWENPLEEGMVIHSSILAWRIPCPTEKLGRLQSIGSQRVRHNWSDLSRTHTALYPGHVTSLPQTPTPVVRHNPRDKFHRNTLWSRLCTSLASAVH